MVNGPAHYIDLILADIRPHFCPFFKEPYETEKGITDAEGYGSYITRNGTAGLDESWQDVETQKDGVYLVTGEYKAIAWFPLATKGQSVALMLINAIQKNRGVTSGVSYNAREIYEEETGEPIRQNLGIVKVEFSVSAPLSVRNCTSGLEC